MLLLLHGSGRNGKTQVEPWLPLAKSEGIVLVALVRLTHSVVDERRMYVCGHSAGAIHGLGLGLLESEYFAGIAAHAAR